MLDTTLPSTWMDESLAAGDIVCDIVQYVQLRGGKYLYASSLDPLDDSPHSSDE